MFKNSITIGMNKKNIYFPYSFYAKTQTPNALKYKYPIKKKKKKNIVILQPHQYQQKS